MPKINRKIRITSNQLKIKKKPKNDPKMTRTGLKLNVYHKRHFICVQKVDVQTDQCKFVF